MDKGFEMANDQIAKATAGGKKVSSMIIAFTDGTLEPVVFSNTKSEARKARHMGATIYAVGVKDFLQSQLEGFTDTKEHAFGVLGGFKALQSITDKLGEKSCIELKSLDPVVACVGGEYRVVVRGSGLQNTRDKSSVICRFKFTDNSIWDETAITVEEKFITCPGVELEEPGEKVFVEISLNKGNNFFANNLSFTSVLCVSTGWGRPRHRACQTSPDADTLGGSWQPGPVLVSQGLLLGLGPSAQKLPGYLGKPRRQGLGAWSQAVTTVLVPARALWGFGPGLLTPLGSLEMGA
ncbi:anthrax toxin receptor-like [Dasypus novemcinctus]|uniref:anthrax toxin receptor-like n=1 Tax=Dasypus novemcinctus TaxID=9361 RepID=UPI00265EFB9B|nr:anthrax toxin receptor-like [Dasypus novemcinctus]